MLACLVVSGFGLKAALRSAGLATTGPAALAPQAGREPLIGSLSEAATRVGVREGMRLGEALATCPQLVLVEGDPAATERAWEAILRSLESVGLAVEPVEPGEVMFETAPVERLYGGVDAVVTRALAAMDAHWQPRVAAAGNRFAARVAAYAAPAGEALVIDDDDLAEFLAPFPIETLPLDLSRARELRELGVQRLGQLAELSETAVMDRLGADGVMAWRLVRGGEAGRVRGRRPAEKLVEQIGFPEPVGNELTLRAAVGLLVERLLRRPERERRFVRTLTLMAELAVGGSWRRAATLREPCAELERLRTVLSSKLADLPGPVIALSCELVELSARRGQQLELAPPAGEGLHERLHEGLRQVRAGVGSGSLNKVVEVAPWSRIPEARALLVPQDG